MNPDLQTKVALEKEKAFTSEIAPTLGQVREAYGKNICNAWIMAQMERINDFAGVKSKMNERQLLELAESLQASVYWLKTTELIYFIQQLKMGEYGSFFGVVDAMVITSKLNKFIEERRSYISNLEQNKSTQKQLEKFNHSVTPEQHEERTKKAQTDIEEFKKIYPVIPTDKPIHEYWELWKKRDSETMDYLYKCNRK